MTWEALSPSPFIFTLSGLTRIGPTTQLPIPLLNAFGIAFLRILYAALTSELINWPTDVLYKPLLIRLPVNTGSLSVFP